MLKTVRVVVLAGALAVAVLGLLLGGLGIAMGLLSAEGARLMPVTAGVSLVALTCGLGLPLARQAWRSLRGQASAPFRPPPTWLLVLLLGVVVAAGHAVQALDLAPVLVLPPLHVLASALPPLIIVAFVGRSLHTRLPGRGIVLQLGSGAFLSTGMAFVAEALFVVALVAAVVAVVAMQPDGMDRIRQLLQRAQDPAWLTDSAALAPVARSPAVIGFLLLVASLLTPAIEEAVKALGIPLALGLRQAVPDPAARRLTLAQAFLWGVAGGAGFALTENLFNSLLGLGTWSAGVLARVPASFLHCFNGGLMGLAWYALLARRHWGRAAGLYLTAVAIHGLWNAASVGLALAGLDTAGAAPGLLGSAGLTLVLGLLFLAVVVGLLVTTRAVRGRDAAAQPGGPEPGPVVADGRPD